VAVVFAGVVASTFWMVATAHATVITVDTTAETAVFSNLSPSGQPTYVSTVVGDDGTTMVPGKCSLREAVEAANTHTAVNGCPAGDGHDTIVLMAGVYHMQDNLFIQERMRIIGPNKGLAGNDPSRGPEAELVLDYNPYWRAQPALLWLDQAPLTGYPLGAGTIIDGVELAGGDWPADCLAQSPSGEDCEESAVDEPDQHSDPGFTLTDSIVRGFTYGLYLGGVHDVITRDLFEDNDREALNSPAQGNDIYADPTFTVADPVIAGNVFADPDNSAIILQGDSNRAKVTGGIIADNAILKSAVNYGAGIYALGVTGLTIKDNLITNPNPAPVATRADSGIWLDKVDDDTVTGNTITDFGSGITVGDSGLPGTPGVTDVTVANNRIYGNVYGIRVKPFVYGGDLYMPLQLDADDNWWGANGGPGSTGARPGAPNPVNGVQFVTSTNSPVANQGGVTVDRWLLLTCTAPSSVTVNVPAPVTGQVLGMPTVDSQSTTAPWFLNDTEPLMSASAPGLGTVYGFDRVPDQGPDNAERTGALLPSTVASGEVFVDLDSELVACPMTVLAGPQPYIVKVADTPTVTPGGLARYHITVTNRGSVPARNLQVCDRIPRFMTFMRADRRLRRRGLRRCMTVGILAPHAHVTLRLTLKVASDPSTDEVTNTANVTPGGDTPAADAPIAQASAKVIIRHVPTSPPPVTG
jgi:uncharacterized repeat protein (TIGR01451 family)/CSLREA domain-containing protein